MWLEISLYVLGGIILGAGTVAIIFALDKTVVRLKENEMLINKNYYSIMRKALDTNGHLHVLRKLAIKGRIKPEDVKDEDPDGE